MRVVILGGGTSGLIAAYQLHRCTRHDIVIVEKAAGTGGAWKGMAALKYLHPSPGLINLMDFFHINYETRSVKGGILVKPDEKTRWILDHPFGLFLGNIGRDIQQRHCKKTMKTFSPRSMNSGANLIVVPETDCIDVLSQYIDKSVSVIYGNVKSVKARVRELIVDNSALAYDYLVTTIPYPDFIEISEEQCQLDEYVNRLCVTCKFQAISQDMAEYDYIYTPYTPSDTVHRIHCNSEGVWVAESGCAMHEHPYSVDFIRKVRSDIDWIFHPLLVEYPSIKKSFSVTKGHIISGRVACEAYPDRIFPIGRYAEWDSRSTLDQTVERAYLYANAIK